MKHFILAITCCFFTAVSWTQEVLSEKEYYQIILLNHPLVKQAGIKPQMGESQLLKAKGFSQKAHCAGRKK
jgi:carbamoylphosphate synthase small subunit